MNQPNLPNGYQMVMPYLIVRNASKFIQFLQEVFDAKERLRVMRTETLIAHAEVNIGESVLMLADSTEAFSPRPGGFFIYVPNADESYQKALDNGATSIHAPADMEYGRSGGVQDAFGNQWWVTSIPG